MSARETILINYREVGDPGTLGHLLDLYALELARKITDLPMSDHWSPEVRIVTRQARKEAANAIKPKRRRVKS